MELEIRIGFILYFFPQRVGKNQTIHVHMICGI